MPKKTKVNIYDDMRQYLRAALAFERGQAVDLRVAENPSATQAHEARRNSPHPRKPECQPTNVLLAFYYVSTKGRSSLGTRPPATPKAQHWRLARHSKKEPRRSS